MALFLVAVQVLLLIITGFIQVQGLTHLTVEVRDPSGKDQLYELHCPPAGGNHPDAQKACDQLNSQTPPGSELFKNEVCCKTKSCTMQYGGTETARIIGTWEDRQVNNNYRRTDDCERARWAKVDKVFGPID